MKKIIFLFYFLFPILLANAQEKCASYLLQEQLIQQKPKIEKTLKENQVKFQQFLQNQKITDDEVLIIPTVIHIMYAPQDSIYGQGSNISNHQIFSQLEVLNDDFRRFNADTINTPSIYKSVSSDTKIQFCLANKDPQGNLSTGINRVKYNASNSHNWIFGDLDMKNLSRWNPDKYLNIWVVGNITGGILGYAPTPDLISDSTYSILQDGVTIAAEFFGSTALIHPDSSHNITSHRFFLGRTLSHELGHYFNLKHIWGDGDCNSDDGIDDTPNCTGQAFRCPEPKPTQCGNIRMMENYMDYSDDPCFNLFTEGQKQAMRATLMFFNFRQNITSETNLIETGCNILLADSMYLLKGDHQVNLVNQFVEDSLAVRLVSENKMPIANQNVNFKITEQPNGAILNLNSNVKTNNEGIAKIPFQFDIYEGDYTITASANVNKGNPVEFQLKAVSKLEDAISIAVFPNPLNQRTLNLELLFIGKQDVEINIFNALGQKILQKEFKQIKSGFYQIDIPNTWSDGVYFISMKEKSIKLILKSKP